MDENLRVRSACLDDILTVSKIMAESWKFAYKNIVNDVYLSSLQSDHWVLFLHNGLNNGTIDCIVAEQNAEIAGSAIVRQSLIEYYPKDGELVALYLQPGTIGQGMGHLLYHSAEEILKQKGFTHCVLAVLPENLRAITFYQSHGFERTQHMIKAILGQQELTCNIMRKAFK